MSFPNIKSNAVRMAILEEKLNAFEEASAKMLDKLESAVDRISEANECISKMLVRHEERIDQSIKTDQTIVNLLDEMKESRKEEKEAIDGELRLLSKSIEDHKKEVEDKIKNTDLRIDDLVKFRWVVVGAIILGGFLVSESGFLGKIFENTPAKEQNSSLIRYF